MTLRNFDCPDELWQEFLKAIDGQYNSKAEALRDLIRRFTEKRKQEKEASADA